MGYLVLARKYRPQLFNELVGQEFVSQTLRNAIRNGRTSHSYLFSGPRGVGKTSAARILAKAVNCLNKASGEGEPCNTCPVCLEITNGQSLDVIEIDGASNRGIDEIRDLRETVKYAPAHSAFKVYIIDEVHMLTKEAFNALLKTLEEPPSHVIFVFATTEPQNVPLTILSRCQRYDFKKITADRIASHISGILAKEGIEAEEEALLTVSRHSGGCLRDAETLLDQLIAFSDGTIRSADVGNVLGLVRQDSFASFFSFVTEDRKKDGLLFLKKLDEDGVEPSTFFAGFLDFLRGVMVVQNTSPEEARDVLDASEREIAVFAESAEKADPTAVLSLMDAVAEGQKDLKFSSLPRVTGEILFLRLTEAARGINLRNLYRQVQSLKGRSASATVSLTPQVSPTPQPEAPPAPAPRDVAADMIRKYNPAPASPALSAQTQPPVQASAAAPASVTQPEDEKKKPLTPLPDLTTLRKEWSGFLAEITESRLNFLKAMDSRHNIESFDPETETLSLGVSNMVLFKLLNQKDNSLLLQEAFRSRFGRSVSFRYAFREPAPPPSPAAAPQEPQTEQHEDVYRKAVQILGGSFSR